MPDRTQERGDAAGSVYTFLDKDGNVTGVMLPDPKDANALITLDAEDVVETVVATGEDYKPNKWDAFTAGWEFPS